VKSLSGAPFYFFSPSQAFSLTPPSHIPLCESWRVCQLVDDSALASVAVPGGLQAGGVHLWRWTPLTRGGSGEDARGGMSCSPCPQTSGDSAEPVRIRGVVWDPMQQDQNRGRETTPQITWRGLHHCQPLFTVSTRKQKQQNDGLTFFWRPVRAWIWARASNTEFA